MAKAVAPEPGLSDLLMIPGNAAGNLAASVTSQLQPVAKVIPKEGFDILEVAFTVGARFLIAIGLLIIGWVISRWLMDRTYRALTRFRISEIAAQFFASAARFVFLFTCIIIAIIQLGGSPQALLAMTGALVVALGLGLKDTLTNVAAGLMLLINQPFRAGDYISINAFQGTVKRINLFQTEINTERNLRMYLPNKLVWDNSVTNHSHNRVRLVELTVPVPRKNDSAKVMLALQKGMASEGRLLPEPAPFVGIDAFNNDVLITYLVRGWVKTTDFYPVRYTLLATLRAALNEAYLDTPDPTLGIPPLPAAEDAKEKEAKKSPKKQPTKKKAKR